MKKLLNCIIVDDEPLAQELVEKFINRISYLSLEAKFDNAIEAIEGIATLQPDIIFLDVQMPEMTGIELLKSFGDHRPVIIMISAHAKYALEGFEYDAVDYLLKPVAFSRFMKAIHKAMEKLHFTPFTNKGNEPNAESKISDTLPQINEKEVSSQGRFFMVKADKKLVKVNMDEIVYVEGMRDYVKIHLHDHFIITHITMTRIGELLPSSQFIRINRSFIVQLAFIKLIEGNMVETHNGKKLMIGINYREPVKEAFKNWTI